LENYLNGLQGKERVRVVCMDLSNTYRALVRKSFSKCAHCRRPASCHPAL
jgi:transposase